MSQAKHLVVVWDLPIRLFHWCLVILVGVLFLTASMGALEVHELAGEGALALLIFRLIWGVVGSQTARFNDFIGGLAAIRQYLIYRQSKSLGHNPLGGLVIIHVTAILLYWGIGKVNLVTPMVTGKKWLAAPVEPAHFGGLILAAAIQCAVVLVIAASLTWR